MKKDHLIKTALIFGGGFVLFMLLRPKEKSASATTAGSKAALNGAGKVNKEDAEIACKAYTEALKADEPPQRLTELNQELMNEFGVRCYVDSKSGNIKVCDTQGKVILEREK